MNRIRIFVIVLVCILYGQTSNAQISATEIIEIFNSATGALSEMDVFVNMDRSLKDIKDFQSKIDSLRKPLDHVKNAKRIYDMAASGEKVACALKDYNELYAAYLGSTWANWDNVNDGSCLTKLDHEFIAERSVDVLDAMKTLTKYIDDMTLSAAELDEQHASFMKRIADITADLAEKTKNLQPKVDYDKAMLKYKKEVMFPNDIDWGASDPTGGQGSQAFFNGFGRTLIGTIFNIMRIFMSLALIPVIWQMVSKNNPTPLYGWLTAFIILFIAYNLFS